VSEAEANKLLLLLHLQRLLLHGVSLHMHRLRLLLHVQRRGLLHTTAASSCKIRDSATAAHIADNRSSRRGLEHSPACPGPGRTGRAEAARSRLSPLLLDRTILLLLLRRRKAVLLLLRLRRKALLLLLLLNLRKRTRGYRPRPASRTGRTR
jgi:hypothetical protein